MIMFHTGQVLKLNLFMLLMILGTTLGQYDPPCQSNCSWTNRAGEIQMCTQEYQSSSSGDCLDIHDNSNTGVHSAPTAENVEVQYYAATHPDRPYSVTKLNISFDLNINGSGIYTGAIIKITNVDLNKVYCHSLSFHGDEVTNDDLLTEDGSIKRISFDCTRYLQTNNQFIITINMLPNNENIKPAITYYWTPSCFDRRDDYFCMNIHEDDLPGYWTPSTYIIDTSGHKRLELTFNLAPYNFDQYVVYFDEKERTDEGIYSPTITGQIYCLNIYVENGTVTDTERCLSRDNFQFNFTSWKENSETIIEITWTDVKEAFYFVEMKPFPTSKGQQCSSRPEVDCMLKSQDVQVKERPCEMIPKPCVGENMLCTVESSQPVCVCKDGFEMQESKCIIKDPCEVIPRPCVGDNMICTVNDSQSACKCEAGFKLQQSECRKEANTGSIIAAVIGSLVGVLAVIFVLWLFCKRQDDSYIKEPYLPGPSDTKQVISKKRVFIIHSYDHKLHNEVVLKLCNFLKNLCKLDVHTALWSTTELGIGVNEWMNTECEEADHVLILCSQGTQIKWRAVSRQIKIDFLEDNMGDLFTTFMRLQTPEFSKNSKKFIVAYMNYSSEQHIPQPLKFLQTYKLMDHIEEMFYRLNELEKYSATQDHNCNALKKWDTFSDAGVELKKAIEQMKKITSDPDWFFHLNNITANEKQQILAMKTRENTRNQDISIISIREDPHVTLQPDCAVVNDDEFQFSALNSLRQHTTQPDGSFTSGYQSQNDSGVNDVTSNLGYDHTHPFHNTFHSSYSNV